MKTRKWMAVAMGAMLGINCAGGLSGRRAQDLELRVRELETTNAELRLQVQELNTRLQMLQARQGAVAAPAVAATDAAAGPPSAPLSPAAAPQDLEVVKLRPPAPAATPRGPQLLTPWPDQPVLRTADGKIIVLPESQNPPADASPASANASSSGNDDAFEEALQVYGEKNYAEAIVKFQQIIEDSSAAAFHDRSFFWLGECYFELGEYEKAADEYGRLTEQFPESEKAPEALYKTGLSYYELGREEKALETIQEVVILYPFSDSAKLAEEKIKEWTR